jgi:hypothetical protein
MDPGLRLACAGMTTMPVRARNLMTAASAGTTKEIRPGASSNFGPAGKLAV